MAARAFTPKVKPRLVPNSAQAFRPMLRLSATANMEARERRGAGAQEAHSLDFLKRTNVIWFKML